MKINNNNSDISKLSTDVLTGYVDLHLHLDGSLPVETVVKLMELQNITNKYEGSTERLKEELSVGRDCRDLNEYLQKFELPLSLLQTREALEIAVQDVALAVVRTGVIYCEIRFAPQLHTRNGLTQKEVVEAVINGANAFLKELENSSSDISTKDFSMKLILCMMRGADNYAENKETIDIAADTEFHKGMVKGIDLAGAEALFKTETFADLFTYAKSKNVGFTIHAGEADGPESMWKAIEFGATRIGHGCAAIYDEKLIKTLIDKQIILEMCPTSNLQTKAVPNIESHPIVEFMKRGVLVTINTDNMTVSDTKIEDEYRLVQETFGLSGLDMKKILENAYIARERGL